MVMFLDAHLLIITYLTLLKIKNKMHKHVIHILTKCISNVVMSYFSPTSCIPLLSEPVFNTILNCQWGQLSVWTEYVKARTS